MKNKIILAVALVALIIASTWACMETEFEDETPVTAPEQFGGRTTEESTESPWNTEVGGTISQEQGKEWIKIYRDKNPDGMRSHFFGKSSVEKVLRHENAVGMSIFYALKPDGTPQLLLAPVDKNGDVLSQEGFEDITANCPSACPNEDQ